MFQPTKSARLLILSVAAGALAAPALWHVAHADPPGPAAPAAPPELPRPQSVTKLYDIRDITLPLQGTENVRGPGFAITEVDEEPRSVSGAVGGLFGPGDVEMQPTKTRDDLVKDLVTTIESTIAPDTWKDTGGVIGSIRELQGQLIISQAPDVQASIQKLLDEVRTACNLQVAVETRILAVDQKTLDSVTAMGPLLTAKQAADLAADAKVKLIAAPRVLMFSGHSGYVANDFKREFIQAFRDRPAQSGDPKAAATQPAASHGDILEPVVESMESGSALEVRATVAADRGSVTVELSDMIAKSKLSPQQVIPGAAGEKGFTSQSPELDGASVIGSFAIPTGMVAVLGGQRVPTPTDAPDSDPSFLLYLVQATIAPPTPPEPKQNP